MASNHFRVDGRSPANAMSFGLRSSLQPALLCCCFSILTVVVAFNGAGVNLSLCEFVPPASVVKHPCKCHEAHDV